MSTRLFKVSTLAAVVLSTSVQADSLLDAVNETLATNPEVLIRTTAADARGDEVTMARAGYLPRVDLTAGIGYENSRNSTTLANSGNTGSNDQSRTRRDASLTARQMLFDGFAVNSEVDRQKARQASAAQEVCSVASNTALQVTRTYINVMRQQSVVELMKTNSAEHERVVELIEKQGRKGRSNEADVAQAQSRRVLAKANEISAESVLRDMKTQYQRLVGNLPSSYSLPEVPDNTPASLESALKQGVNAHPVMKLASADVNAAEAQYDSSKSAYMPRFELEVGANWDTDANGGKGDTYNHVAKVNMTYNLFNGGGDKARRSQTSKLVNEAIEVRNRARRQVEEEVRLAWVAVDFGVQRLVPLEDHVRQSGKSRELYNKQFLMGSRTLMDLLDSQNEFTTARQSEINARYDLLFNQFRLLNSTGSLLTALDASLPVENDCGVKVVAAL
ncbi:TolC family outer membrane protein [Endozoicomonas sp.]|uniref:TolC family outer membrane protein n=1 Tax=Endozoicomonas sp. TaxID=1892382 RepID=UPI002886D287|nr:TolC family outer membrane protein [Endozoicomonas sp.]